MVVLFISTVAFVATVFVLEEGNALTAAEIIIPIKMAAIRAIN